jgi:hypothetical protein
LADENIYAFLGASEGMENPLPDHKNPGLKALSWQMSLCIVLGILAFIFGGMAFHPNGDAQVQRVGEHALFIIVPLAVLLIACEILMNRSGKQEPDILIELYSLEQIYQRGDAQYVFTAEQAGPFLRVRVAFQNLRSRPGVFYFKAHTLAGEGCHLETPILRAEMPGACVALAVVDLPLPKLTAALSVDLQFSGSGKAGGRRVRTANRQATLGTTDWMFRAPLRAVLPNDQAPGLNTRSTVTAGLSPYAGDEAKTEPIWQIRRLWDPQKPAEIGQIRVLIGAGNS